MKDLKPKGPATRLLPEELDELTRQMLRNLSDPDVRKRVDEAEVHREKEMKEAFSKRTQRTDK